MVKRVGKILEGSKQVNESLRPLSVRNSMGEELTRENDIERIWKEYFVRLLNGDEIGEVGGDVRGRGL